MDHMGRSAMSMHDPPECSVVEQVLLVPDVHLVVGLDEGDLITKLFIADQAIKVPRLRKRCGTTSHLQAKPYAVAAFVVPIGPRDWSVYKSTQAILCMQYVCGFRAVWHRTCFIP